MHIVGTAFDQVVARTAFEHRGRVAQQVVFGRPRLRQEPAHPGRALASLELLEQADRAGFSEAGRRVNVIEQLAPGVVMQTDCSAVPPLSVGLWLLTKVP